jgi:hypothetical protein
MEKVQGVLVQNSRFLRRGVVSIEGCAPLFGRESRESLYAWTRFPRNHVMPSVFPGVSHCQEYKTNLLISTPHAISSPILTIDACMITMVVCFSSSKLMNPHLLAHPQSRPCLPPSPHHPPPKYSQSLSLRSASSSPSAPLKYPPTLPSK